MPGLGIRERPLRLLHRMLTGTVVSRLRRQVDDLFVQFPW